MKTSKKTRRGFAGDDVTENKDYQEEVLKSEDDSYVVEDTDSPEEITEESEVITDDHEVVIEEDTGTEEDFVAEAEDGEAEEIDEEEISDELRMGKRRGESEEPEDKIEEDEEVLDLVMNEDGDTEEVTLPEPDEEEDRKGSRRGSVYGGKSPEHQESIRAAVAIAMKDRRL